MKIEKVENNKIKVTLTFDDLVLYDISDDNVTLNSPKLHNFLFDIMESVKEKTGFDPGYGQVVVEAVKNKEGITLFISKLKSLEEIDLKNEVNKKAKTVKINKNIHKNRFTFKAFKTLCDCFKIVNEESFKGSCLYKYDGNWFITVPSKNIMLNSVLREYCDNLKENSSDLFLKEHAKIVAKGEKLISLVKGIKGLD